MVLIASVFHAIPFAKADIIFTNYTGIPNSNPYNLYGSNVAGGAATKLAEGFTTPNAAYTLDSIMVLVSVFDSYSGLFDLSIDSSVNNQPALEIEQLGTNLVAPNSPGAVIVNSSLHPVLAIGTDYWVVLTAADPNTYLHNYGGSSNPIPTEYYSSSFGWSSNPVNRDIQLEIAGTPVLSPVPEPSSLILLAGAVAAFLVRRTKGRSWSGDEGKGLTPRHRIPFAAYSAVRPR